jgi:hypothetical protein
MEVAWMALAVRNLFPLMRVTKDRKHIKDI